MDRQIRTRPDHDGGAVRDRWLQWLGVWMSYWVWDIVPSCWRRFSNAPSIAQRTPHAQGLVRPSISFNLNELKNNAPESTTFICVVQLGDKTKIVATPNPFAEVALIGLLLPNPNDIDVPFIVVAVGDGKTVVRAVRSQLTGRTKDGWYNVPAENLNRAIIAAAQRENVKTVPTSWEVLVAAMSAPAAKRDWFDRHPVLVWFFILLILGGFFMLFLIARAAP